MFFRLAVLVASISTLLLGNQDGAPVRQIRVYVANGSDGFTTSGGGDSSADLTKSLRRKTKTIQLVDTPGTAEVVVRVTSRNEEKKLGTITTYKEKSKNGRDETATTIPTEDTTRIVHATIKAGDFETDLQGQGPFWGMAADNLAGQVDRWIKQNYARLLEKRFATHGDKQAAQNNAAPADSGPPPTAPADISIDPGMTAQQVTAQMGEPLKKVNFGTKSLWTYKGCQVVFENGKVTDVKF